MFNLKSKYHEHRSMLRSSAQGIVAAFFMIVCLSFPMLAQDKFGTVYFYRDRDTDNTPQELGVLNPEVVVYLAGQPFFSISERTFIGFKMAVGRYRVHTTINGKYTYRTIEVNSGGISYIHISQVMYPYAWQTITEDSFPSAFAALRKCDALKAKKVKINMFEMIRENPTTKK